MKDLSQRTKKYPWWHFNYLQIGGVRIFSVIQKTMTKESVQELFDDIRLFGKEQISLVEAVRGMVKKFAPSVTEELKYGGIVFSSGVQFCGVFAYKKHVSVEFSSGAKIQDILGHLEGAGKGRRHIKLHTVEDIEAKALNHYLPLALKAAKSVGG
jgi:hypothetical protein